MTYYVPRPKYLPTTEATFEPTARDMSRNMHHDYPYSAVIIMLTVIIFICFAIYRAFKKAAEKFQEQQSHMPSESEQHISAITADQDKILSAVADRPNDQGTSRFNDIPRQLQPLSRSTKAMIVLGAFWTGFVFLRTAVSFRLLGTYFPHWDKSAFLANWLVVPAVVLCIMLAVRWVLTDNNTLTPNRSERSKRRDARKH